MSEKERNVERHEAGQTEEPTQDSTGDDFEAHRNIDRNVERNEDGGQPNRDADAGRNID
ncbi:MAG: hypothetical protein H0T61_02060 [Actinobacteria bacterium]|nr:hypothetical protein [Actinomycetota bacterium]